MVYQLGSAEWLWGHPIEKSLLKPDSNDFCVKAS